MESLDIVTAWVKRSGVDAVSRALKAVRSRGVATRAIVGISLGGTSRQGLEALLDCVDEVYIYQHSGRTFHPKVYRASNSESACTLVGSHNLTAGGVANNFEAGTLGRLDLTDEGERRYHRDLRSYIQRLSTDAATKRVDSDLIAALTENDRYVLLDESKSTATGDESGTRSRPQDGHLFQQSQESLREFIPPRPSENQKKISGSEPRKVRLRESGPGLDGLVIDRAEDVESEVAVRWFKQLGKIDAQQGDSPNWNPSNTVTLVSAGHPIDRSTFFRDELFEGLTWESAISAGGRQREVADLAAEVILDGEGVGDYRFTVRHTPDYHSGQANRTTELRWGELAHEMRSVDRTGKFLTLERLVNGTFRVHVGPKPPGPFKTSV